MFLQRSHKTGFLFAAALALCWGGCVTKEIGKTGIAIPLPSLPIPGLPFFGRGTGDLRHLGWEKAFGEMHARLAREYPFTEHKQIDWVALHDQFAPLIAKAEEEDSPENYYLALRQYLYSIPDGFVGMGEEEEIEARHTGGTLGLGLARLDSGEVIVVTVDADGAAARAGVKWGDTLVAVEGQAVDAAVAATPYIWAAAPPATSISRDRARLHRLTHPAPGSKVTLRLRDEAGAERDLALDAAADSGAVYGSVLSGAEHDEHAKAITWMMKSEEVGYIGISFFAPSMAMPFPERALAQAITELKAKGAKALIVDLRANTGGMDALAARLAGYFVTKETLYADISYYEEKSKQFEQAADERLLVQPATPSVDVPVFLLVNYRTAGAAEGFARVLRDAGGARVAGFEGTHGSMGVTGGGLTMPEGFTVFYPVGRMTGAEGQVIVTADGAGRGGIEPEIRVPSTREALQARHRDGKDFVLEIVLQAARAVIR